MVLGILSDTHGNHRLMHMAVDRMVGLGATMLVHLGDDYADAEVLRFVGYEVMAVPGLWCPEYAHPRIPNKIDETLAGVRIVAVHAPQDLSRADSDASLVLHGHTHRSGIVREGGGLVVNPGHLKSSRDRGEPPSFAVAELAGRRVEAVVFDLQGREMQRLGTSPVRE